MREIVLDTETTGLEPAQGHRIIEIAALELMNHVPTGVHFHTYLDPEREVEAGAASVHGLTTEDLRGKPRFADIADEMLDFFGSAPLVIHNAPFDMGFLNAELRRADRPALPMSRAIDTLAMARRKFPGAPASLDALCKRFNVDTTGRELHGALIDADLLAQVYLELIGGRQPGLELERGEAAQAGAGGGRGQARARPVPLAPRLTPEEAAAHEAFVGSLGENALWTRFGK
jgi:DNA polymerase-3 subunit epsilon